MNEKRKSLFALHLSSLLFGGTGLFAKLIDLPVIDITAVRALIASAGLFILLKITKQRIALDTPRDYAIMLVQGVLMGVHWVTFFYSIQISSVAVGIISLFTYPIITVFLEPLWRGQKPHLSDIICGTLVLFGIYLMVPEFSFDNTVTRGLCWGIFSAFMFSLRNVVQRNYLAAYRGDTSMMYQSFIAGIIGMIFITSAACSINAMTGLKLVVLALFFTAVPHSFFAGSLRYLKAKSASLISCLQPVYGTIYAFVILYEVPEIKTVIGGAVIMLSATVESYRA
jgi:drug/metabolite transporter (DMT)-like permease